MKKDFVDMMMSHRQTQTEAERQAMKTQVLSVVEQSVYAPVLSPYQPSFWLRNYVSSLVIASLVMVFGLGGVAEASRPGDLLFPVERTLEEARLVFTAPAQKSHLEAKYIKQRVAEMDQVLKEVESRRNNLVTAEGVIQIQNDDVDDLQNAFLTLQTVLSQYQTDKAVKELDDFIVKTERLRLTTGEQEWRFDKKRFEFRSDHNRLRIDDVDDRHDDDQPDRFDSRREKGLVPVQTSGRNNSGDDSRSDTEAGDDNSGQHSSDSDRAEDDDLDSGNDEDNSGSDDDDTKRDDDDNSGSRSDDDEEDDREDDDSEDDDDEDKADDDDDRERDDD